MLLNFILLLNLSLAESKETLIKYETPIGSFTYRDVDKIKNQLTVSDIYFYAEERDDVLISAKKVIESNRKLELSELELIYKCFDFRLTRQNHGLALNDSFDSQNFSKYTNEIINYRVKIEVRYPVRVSVEVDSKNGDTFFTGKGSKIAISSKDGDVKAEDFSCEEIAINVGNGDISLSKVNLLKNSYAETKNGDIRLTANDKANLSVETKANKGEVIFKGKEKEIKKDNKEHFLFGEPKTKLKLVTGNGDIILSKN